MFSYKHCLNSSFWNFFCFFLPCYRPSTQSTCNFSHCLFKIVLFLVPLYFFSSGQFIPVEGKTPSFIWLVTVESARKPPRTPQFNCELQVQYSLLSDASHPATQVPEIF